MGSAAVIPSIGSKVDDLVVGKKAPFAFAAAAVDDVVLFSEIWCWRRVSGVFCRSMWGAC